LENTHAASQNLKLNRTYCCDIRATHEDRGDERKGMCTSRKICNSNRKVVRIVTNDCGLGESDGHEAKFNKRKMYRQKGDPDLCGAAENNTLNHG
jgi:hypothetical protein